MEKRGEDNVIANRGESEAKVAMLGWKRPTQSGGGAYRGLKGGTCAGIPIHALQVLVVSPNMFAQAPKTSVPAGKTTFSVQTIKSVRNY